MKSLQMHLHEQDTGLPLNHEHEKVAVIHEISWTVGRNLETLGELSRKIRLGSDSTNFHQVIIGQGSARSQVICRGNLSSLNSSGVKRDSRTIGKDYIDHGAREEKSVAKA